MVSPMQNEGKTDNTKTMITFLSNDFSASSDSLEYVKVNSKKNLELELVRAVECYRRGMHVFLW